MAKGDLNISVSTQRGASADVIKAFRKDDGDKYKLLAAILTTAGLLGLASWLLRVRPTLPVGVEPTAMSAKDIVEMIEDIMAMGAIGGGALYGYAHRDDAVEASKGVALSALASAYTGARISNNPYVSSNLDKAKLTGGYIAASLVPTGAAITGDIAHQMAKRRGDADVTGQTGYLRHIEHPVVDYIKTYLRGV